MYIDCHLSKHRVTWPGLARPMFDVALPKRVPMKFETMRNLGARRDATRKDRGDDRPLTDPRRYANLLRCTYAITVPLREDAAREKKKMPVTGSRDRSVTFVAADPRGRCGNASTCTEWRYSHGGVWSPRATNAHRCSCGRRPATCRSRFAAVVNVPPSAEAPERFPPESAERTYCRTHHPLASHLGRGARNTPRFTTATQRGTFELSRVPRRAAWMNV